MPRAKTGAASTRRHKKVLRAVSGHRGAPGRWYRAAIAARMRAGRFATLGRKIRKRDFRSLWITRINAAVRPHNLTYNRFIAALIKLNMTIDRKVLAEMAVADPLGFSKIVEMAKGSKV